MTAQSFEHSYQERDGQKRAYSACRLDAEQWLSVPRLPPTSAFQTPVFVSTLLDTIARAKDAEPVLIGVRDSQGELVAVVPFVLRKRMGARVLEALDFHVVDYFAPTLDPDHALDPDALWGAVLGALPKADAITLKKVPQRLHGRRHALSDAKWLKPMGTAAYATRLGTEVDPSRFSVAKDARRKSRKLAAVGELDFREACGDRDVATALQTMFDFRLERFAELGRPDPLADAAYRQFYQRLAVGPAPLARIFVLSVGNEIVAVVYTLCHDDVLTLVIPSFSQASKWSAGSPGLIALYRTVEWAAANGMDAFDLSVGTSDYKSRFDAERLELFEYQKALTLFGIPTVLEASLRRRVRHLVRKYPQLRGIPDRIRRFASFGSPG